MILIFKGIAILFFIVSGWVCIKYFAYKIAKNEAFNEFDTIKKQIDNQYDFILYLISKYESSMVNEQKQITEIKDLITKAKNFSLEKDGADIIIAFANAVFQKTEGIVTNYTDILEEYRSSHTKFNNYAEKYNNAAKKLRYYIDVFPTSFICRLSKVKTLNYIY